jgi:hypothetical protein
VETYLILALVVIFINALPAFAPPTWTILVFFEIQYALNPIALVVIGMASAVTGRAILAWYFRRFADLVPTRFSRNMVEAGQYLEKSSTTKYSILALFFISPLSSAQLFEAAGLMKTIALKPLLGAFALGRLISYSGYVTGAHVLGETSFGSLVIDHLKSPWVIALQIAMIGALVGLGMVDWKKVLKR